MKLNKKITGLLGTGVLLASGSVNAINNNVNEKNLENLLNKTSYSTPREKSTSTITISNEWIEPNSVNGVSGYEGPAVVSANVSGNPSEVRLCYEPSKNGVSDVIHADGIDKKSSPDCPRSIPLKKESGDLWSANTSFNYHGNLPNSGEILYKIKADNTEGLIKEKKFFANENTGDKALEDLINNGPTTFNCTNCTVSGIGPFDAIYTNQLGETVGVNYNVESMNPQDRITMIEDMRANGYKVHEIPLGSIDEIEFNLQTPPNTLPVVTVQPSNVGGSYGQTINIINNSGVSSSDLDGGEGFTYQASYTKNFTEIESNSFSCQNNSLGIETSKYRITIRDEKGKEIKTEEREIICCPAGYTYDGNEGCY